MIGRQSAAAFFAGMLLLSLGAWADDLRVGFDRVISGDEIALGDKRIVRLKGTKALAPEAADFLAAAIGAHPLILRDAADDRYGRVTATVFVEGQDQSLEDGLLKAGLAFVYPAAGDDARLDEMLSEEQVARHAKTGYWAAHPDVSSDDAEKLYGKYGFVTGTVVKAERVKNKVYLNFGVDWRTDFTVAIAAHDLRAFKKAEMEALSLQGKKLRVRGWVKRDFGPMITVTDPHQIEVLR